MRYVARSLIIFSAGIAISSCGEDIRDRSDKEKIFKICSNAVAAIVTTDVLVSKYNAFEFESKALLKDLPGIEVSKYDAKVDLSCDDVSRAPNFRASVNADFDISIDGDYRATLRALCVYEIRYSPHLNNEEFLVKLSHVMLNGEKISGSDIFGDSLSYWSGLPRRLRPDRDCGVFSKYSCFQYEYFHRNKCVK